MAQKVGTAEEGKEKAEEEIVRTEESLAIKVKEAATAAKSEYCNYFSCVLAKEKVKLVILKLNVERSKCLQTTLLNANVSLIYANTNHISV